MPVLGITGGIACGKSSFTAALLECLPAARFDADAAAHELLASDREVHAGIRERFGSEVFEGERPSRQRLRELVFQAPARRAELEAILHPAIRAQWIQQAERFRTEPEWLLVDIPLLYETKAQRYFDRVVVVACSPTTQRARLRTHRGHNEELLENIIGAQHDLGFKMREADHVIWNDSTVSCLSGQAKLLAGWLRNYHV